VDRNSLSPSYLEQITVVRMFIRIFGWSQRIWLCGWPRREMGLKGKRSSSSWQQPSS
jgi:hypothetical protein